MDKKQKKMSIPIEGTDLEEQVRELHGDTGIPMTVILRCVGRAMSDAKPNIRLLVGRWIGRTLEEDSDTSRGITNEELVYSTKEDSRQAIIDSLDKAIAARLLGEKAPPHVPEPTERTEDGDPIGVAVIGAPPRAPAASVKGRVSPVRRRPSMTDELGLPRKGGG